MKSTFLISLLALFTITSIGQVSIDQCIEDIDQLYALIEKEHVQPYWNNSNENILNIVQEAKAKIQKKTSCDETCYVEFLKIVAALNESHSYVSGKSRYAQFGYLPISIKWFEDGLYIVKTSSEYEEILGHQITSIDGMEIDDVIIKIQEVIPNTNYSRVKKYIGSYMHLPGLLYGLGISRNPNEAKFGFEKNNIYTKRILKNVTPAEEENLVFKSIPLSDAYFHRNSDLFYWFDHDPDQKLVYFQYNRISNMDSESSTAFANRLWATVDSVEVDKFVLDLRYNGGGSFPYSLKFIQGIIDRPKINKRGKLFVITGYDTFSAAITMVNQLEQKTEAIIVGEYPCASPSHPGDPENYKLNNSGIEVSLSSLFHPTFYEGDNRKATKLDQHLALFWKDYSTGTDPSLDYILAYEAKDFLPVSVKDHLDKLGVYEYSPIRNLHIKAHNYNLYLEIDGAVFSPLYKSASGEFYTEINGLTVSIEDECINLKFPDGKNQQVRKLESSSISAIEYLYKGDFENTEKIFLQIKAENPNFFELKDHQMSFLANIVFFELKNHPKIDASSIAKSILNLGIEMNEGNAPFCEFSLRFY